jgi:hypothetical protein
LCLHLKSKQGKFLPKTDREFPQEEHRNCSTLSLTSTLDEGWVVQATTLFLTVTTVQEVWVSPTDGLDGRSKLRHPSDFDPRTVQPVAGLYTDCTIPAHTISSFVSMKYNFMICSNYLETFKTCDAMWHKITYLLHTAESFLRS